MKNQLLFAVSSLLVTVAIYYCPFLFINVPDGCIADIRIIICVIQAWFLLLYQGQIKTTEVSKSVKKDILLTYSILLIGAASQICSVFEYLIFRIDHYVLFFSHLDFLYLFIALAGNQIRITAILKLDENFKPSIAPLSSGTLIKSWLFKYVRHVSYLGSLMFLLGNCLFLHAYITFCISAFVLIILYNLRIKIEENQLEEFYKESYKEYKKNTWKILPYIW